MMKRIVFVMMIFITWNSHAVVWRHNGIYIVNKSEGELTIRWNNQELRLKPARINEISKILVPVTMPGTKIKISYSDTIPAHAELRTCRGGAHASFKTSKRIVLYEIYGGHQEGKGAFNQPGHGPHCYIHVHHQRYTADHAIEKYPDLK